MLAPHVLHRKPTKPLSCPVSTGLRKHPRLPSERRLLAQLGRSDSRDTKSFCNSLVVSIERNSESDAALDVSRQRGEVSIPCVLTKVLDGPPSKPTCSSDVELLCHELRSHTLSKVIKKAVSLPSRVIPVEEPRLFN